MNGRGRWQRDVLFPDMVDHADADERPETACRP